MQANDASAVESFQFLLSQISPVKAEPVLFYPEKALQRIRNEQMSVFYEECIKEELVIRCGKGYSLTQKGLETVKKGDTAKLLSPYHRARKRINLLYVDVLI